MVVELNDSMRRDLPSHRFVATTLVNLDVASGVVEIWNGGNPPCILIDGAGTRLLAGRHLPLGVAESEEIDPLPERHALRPDTQMLLYSDGAIEALDAQGKPFGEESLVSALSAAAPAARFEAVKLSVVDHLAGEAASDDVTLVLIDVAAELRRRGASGITTSAHGWPQSDVALDMVVADAFRDPHQCLSQPPVI
jgi:serine phosphatase RsbU (regulator of sigma subunit)